MSSSRIRRTYVTHVLSYGLLSKGTDISYRDVMRRWTVGRRVKETYSHEATKQGLEVTRTMLPSRLSSSTSSLLVYPQKKLAPSLLSKDVASSGCYFLSHI